MTDDDRDLLLELSRLSKECGEFCAGVLEDDLSRDDRLALSDWLAGMAERIRKRGLRTPVVIEGERGYQMTSSADASSDGCDREQAGQTGGGVTLFIEASEAE